MRATVLLISLIVMRFASAQSIVLEGKVLNEGNPVPFAAVGIKSINKFTNADSSGNYRISGLPKGNYLLEARATGFIKYQTKITFGDSMQFFNLQLTEEGKSLEEVVVTGTMKEVTKMESPVPIEVYNARFFQKNPSASIFDAMQNVNGVRPQMNCNVCNTGDIHINGLEGPYTMVMIDGMPIVSGLSTVYGLMGIPMSLIERIEIVKGPASSLYGSEAIGGIINVITKKVQNAPSFSIDVNATSWLETNLDLGFKFKLGKRTSSLAGLNYYDYRFPMDNNKDGFTDVTLQKRISFFNKYEWLRESNRTASLMLRYLYEDRWGGQMNWDKQFWGTDSIYGEAIKTNRIEAIGKYMFPFKENIFLNSSYNTHLQESAYGATVFNAAQHIFFNQLYWQKKIAAHDLLLGASFRYIYYDDNTIVTKENDSIHFINKPTKTSLPGIFIQDELKFGEKHVLLFGFRFDYHTIHKQIYTPRFAYKLSINSNSSLRVNAGTGFRVANIYSEDHAALTGSREVVLASAIRPEQSANLNINYVVKKIGTKAISGIDFSIFYSHFSNKIIADYTIDANKIVFDNLNGYAISRGMTFNTDFSFLSFPLKILAGVTYMENFKVEEGKRVNQMLTERFSGTWSVSYEFKNTPLTIDYTGNIYSPMLLPLLGSNDPRPSRSPWWSIQNVQITYKVKSMDWYVGVKNLLNFTPPANSIARSFDPFDKQVQFDSNGQAIATLDNPHALTFDPSYVFAPNQGVRAFIGIRFKLF